MAASSTTLTTPVKLIPTGQCRQCVLCGIQGRRLHVFSQKKAMKENYVRNIEKFLGVSISSCYLSTLGVCEVCIKKCTSSITFRKDAFSNYTNVIEGVRSKRQAKTPTSALKQRVADQLQQSLEKLRGLDISNNFSKDPRTTGPHKTRRCLLSTEAEFVDKNTATGTSPLTTVSHLGPLLPSLAAVSALESQESKLIHKSLPSNLCPAAFPDHDYYRPSHKTSMGPQEEKCDNATIKATESLSVSSHSSVASDIDKQLKALCKPGISVLCQRQAYILMEENCFAKAVNELHSNCPMLLEILSVCLGDKLTPDNKIATIGTMYGMMMHARNKQISAIQRVYTSLAVQFHADNKLLRRLNKVHITLSDESKRHLLEEFSAYSTENIIKKCSEGKDGKINGDNLDIYVKTNDIRMDNKNKDYHFFASDFTFDRMRFDHLDNTRNIGNPDSIDYKMFVPSLNEVNLYRKSLKVLIGRQLVENVKGFEWMKAVIPSHIPHDFEDVMSQKSPIFLLPLQLNNEMYLDQCIEIMDQSEKQITSFYSKAGRGGALDLLKIPVGGDQLTRVNLQSAKSLKAGCHTQQERLDHLYPVVVEMFHTLMDFLEKLFKRFFNSTSGRDAGTLSHLKVVIQRTNVNGQVKSRFEAHEDFLLLVGKAYLLVLAMKVFAMEDLNDKPQHALLKDNMKNMHTKQKEKVFDTLMEEILDVSLLSFDFEEKETDDAVNLLVTIGSTTSNVTSKVVNDSVTVTISRDHKTFRVSVPYDKTKKGCKVCFTSTEGVTINMFVKQHITEAEPTDDLHNYVTNFMQWYFVILHFKDTICEGDIFRTNMILKQMVPFFFSHSSLSKYCTECIDYILKTEIMLSPQLSMRVRLSSFVNVKGGKGKNKAADMQKENQVRVLKDLIKGLGSNKTEHAIVIVSKAAPVINAIVANYDENAKVKEKGTRHRKRDAQTDLETLVSNLKSLNPFTKYPGRQLSKTNRVPKTPFNFDKTLLKSRIASTVERLKRGLPTLDQEPEMSDDDYDVVEAEE